MLAMSQNTHSILPSSQRYGKLTKWEEEKAKPEKKLYYSNCSNIMHIHSTTED
jgi:hypothetical protein